MQQQKKNAPKNWVKEEAQRWRINQDGILSGKQRSALSARERGQVKLMQQNCYVAKRERNCGGSSKERKEKTGAKKKRKIEVTKMNVIDLVLILNAYLSHVRLSIHLPTASVTGSIHQDSA